MRLLGDNQIPGGIRKAKTADSGVLEIQAGLMVDTMEGVMLGDMADQISNCMKLKYDPPEVDVSGWFNDSRWKAAKDTQIYFRISLFGVQPKFAVSQVFCYLR